MSFTQPVIYGRFVTTGYNRDDPYMFILLSFSDLPITKSKIPKFGDCLPGVLAFPMYKNSTYTSIVFTAPLVSMSVNNIQYLIKLKF